MPPFAAIRTSDLTRTRLEASTARTRSSFCRSTKADYHLRHSQPTTAIILWLLSDLLDDGTCTGKTDGALGIVNPALRYSEATPAGATFGVELLHRFEPSLGR